MNRHAAEVFGVVVLLVGLAGCASPSSLEAGQDSPVSTTTSGQPEDSAAGETTPSSLLAAPDTTTPSSGRTATPTRPASLSTDLNPSSSTTTSEPATVSTIDSGEATTTTGGSDPTTTTTSTTPAGPTAIPCPAPYWPTPKPYQHPPAQASAKVNLVRVGVGAFGLSAVVNSALVPPVYTPTTLVLDRLAITADYETGKRTYEVAVSGHRLAPGEEATFAVPETTPEAPTNFVVADFDYHCST